MNPPNSTDSTENNVAEGNNGGDHSTTSPIPYKYDGEGEVRNTNRDVEMIVVEDHVERIPDRAFNGCTSLSSIIIPNTVTSIGNGAFNGCTSLSSIIIPNTVTSIGDRAFFGCTSLSSIIIPNTVTSNGIDAFYGCTSLSSIIIPNTVTFIGDGAFGYCTSLSSIIIPNTVTSIGDGAFGYCKKLIIVEVPDSTYIHKEAFNECNMLNCDNNPDKLKGRFNKLPLHRLCYRQDITVEKLEDYFINNKNNINHKNEEVDEWKCTALHILACNPNATSDALEVLIKHCGNLIKKLDKSERGFLHYACENYFAFPVSSYMLHLKDSNGDYIPSKADKYKDNIMTIANRCRIDSFSDNKMEIFSVYPLKSDAGNNNNEKESIKN